MSNKEAAVSEGQWEKTSQRKLDDAEELAKKISGRTLQANNKYKIPRVKMKMVYPGGSRKANIDKQEWGRKKKICYVAREEDRGQISQEPSCQDFILTVKGCQLEVFKQKWYNLISIFKKAPCSVGNIL